MRKLLRIVAAIVALGGLGFWLAAGANPGWTKNRVPKKTTDEVTGIEGVSYEERFVPGVDFLALAIAGAGTSAGISFLFGKKKEFELKKPKKP